MTKHEQAALDLFGQGYNCAQAVFTAFCDETGMTGEQALRLSSSLGGGMGRLREVCGALSGAFLVLGVLYGYDQPQDSDAKAAHYARIQYFAGLFKQRTGSLICRELLALPPGPDSPVPSARTETFYTLRPCRELVGIAASLLDDYIADHPH